MNYKQNHECFLAYLATQYNMIKLYREQKGNKGDYSFKFAAQMATMPIDFALENTDITLDDIKSVADKKINDYKYEERKCLYEILDDEK